MIIIEICIQWQLSLKQYPSALSGLFLKNCSISVYAFYKII